MPVASRTIVLGSGDARDIGERIGAVAESKGIEFGHPIDASNANQGEVVAQVGAADRNLCRCRRVQVAQIGGIGPHLDGVVARSDRDFADDQVCVPNRKRVCGRRVVIASSAPTHFELGVVASHLEIAAVVVYVRIRGTGMVVQLHTTIARVKILLKERKPDGPGQRGLSVSVYPAPVDDGRCSIAYPFPVCAMLYKLDVRSNVILCEAVPDIWPLVVAPQSPLQPEPPAGLML